MAKSSESNPLNFFNKAYAERFAAFNKNKGTKKLDESSRYSGETDRTKKGVTKSYMKEGGSTAGVIDNYSALKKERGKIGTSYMSPNPAPAFKKGGSSKKK